MIRRATEDDIPRLLAIAAYAYPEFDLRSSMEWGLRALENPDIGIWLGERTLGVSGVSAPFYAPLKKRGTMLFLASEPGAGWEPCKVLRAMIQWSRERGADAYYFGEATGIDLSPLAKRVGAVVDRPSYTVTHGQAHPRHSPEHRG